jgi:plastocyanin
MLGMNVGLARRRTEPTRRSLHPVLLALLCCGAGILGVLTPLLNASSSTALACGLQNNPTMLANNQPSILLPKPGGPPDRGVTGFFAGDFVVGQPISFTEDLSNMLSAPPAATLQWRWDFGDGTTVGGLTPSHTFAKPGKYIVYSEIFIGGSWDNDFDSAYLTVIAAAPSAPPVAVATSSTIITDPNTPVVFDASGSHSQDGSPLTYYWNFADFTTSSDPHVSHPFSAIFVSELPAATSVVTLIITDAHGAQTVKYFNIEIVRQLPTVQLDSSATDASTGDTVTFTASASLPPTATPGGQPSGGTSGGQSAAALPVQYVWNFGDGSRPLTTTMSSVTHTFQKGGSFHVTVQGLDQHGYPYPSTGAVIISVSHDYTSLVLAILGGLIVVVGGFFAIRGQLRRNRLIRERAAAMALARARAVQAGLDRRTHARLRAVAPRPPYGEYGDRPPRGSRRPE